MRAQDHGLLSLRHRKHSQAHVQLRFRPQLHSPLVELYPNRGLEHHRHITPPNGNACVQTLQPLHPTRVQPGLNLVEVDSLRLIQLNQALLSEQRVPVKRAQKGNSTCGLMTRLKQ